MTKTKKKKQSPIKRLYQLWHKSNRFYCNGRLVTGPKTDFPISIAPYIVFTIVIALYSYFIMVDMLEYNIILCISFLISFTATITFMLLTSYTDPSIIPQRPFLLLQQRQLQQSNKQNNNNNQHLLIEQKQYQRLQYLLYQCSDPQQIFCQTCHIYRPQSTSHCRQCDNCILQMDHHCPWLNTCVGRNNYKWFILFIVSLVAMMVVFCCNVLVWMDGVVMGKRGRDGGYGDSRVRDGRDSNMDRENNNTDDNRDDSQGDNMMLNVYITMCFIIVGALILVILAFCVFHLYLLCRGKTTRQFIKQSKKKKKNINKDKIKRNKQQQQHLNEQQQQQQITDRLINVEDGQVAVDYQQQSQQQNQKQNRNSIKIENTTNNQINKRLQTSHLLDQYIQSHYRQPKTFYKQLFKPSSIFQNIHFVNFNKEITLQQEQFLLKDFDQMKEKRRQLKQNGKPTVYYKMVVGNGGNSSIIIIG